jgi:[acyl-carrier-protein] S-malonyltransferase
MRRDVVAGCRDSAALATTDFVQPALLACDVAAFRVLEAEGASFAGVAGHSLGEFAAFVTAGVMSLDDALDLVVVRGAAMQGAGEERPGAMTALLGMGAEDAAALCAEVRGDDVLVVANENTPMQVVIAGSVPAIERAETLAKDRKVRTIRLPVAGAFHSPLMEPARAAIDERIDAITFAAPRFPVAENVAGAIVSDPEELRSLLKQHVVSPVKWVSSVRALAIAGTDSFLEAGPGDVLTKLMKRIVPDAAARAVGSPEDARGAA